MSHAEAGVSRAVGEVAQHLEKDLQATASGIVTTIKQQMQVRVGVVSGELQTQIKSGH